MDVWNSRGKFDDIKEKFVINPAPIASQSSINAGDHDELEIFLKICLIPSRIDQKLSLQRERTSNYREVCAKLVDRGPRHGFHSV